MKFATVMKQREELVSTTASSYFVTVNMFIAQPWFVDELHSSN